MSYSSLMTSSIIILVSTISAIVSTIDSNVFRNFIAHFKANSARLRSVTSSNGRYYELSPWNGSVLAFINLISCPRRTGTSFHCMRCGSLLAQSFITFFYFSQIRIFVYCFPERIRFSIASRVV